MVRIMCCVYVLGRPDVYFSYMPCLISSSVMVRNEFYSLASNHVAPCGVDTGTARREAHKNTAARPLC